MAGGANTKSSSHRHPSAASSSSFSNHRKSRWEFSNSTPNHHSNHPQKPKLPTPTNPQSNNNVKNPKLPNNNAQSATTATPKNPNPRMPNPNPIPIPNPIPPPSASSSSPFPFPGLAPPPPPPSYGFHMLDRRTIALADGSVRSYFALPPDYHDFPPRSLPPPLPFPGPSIRFPPMSPDGLPFRGNDPNFIQNPSLKRKFGGIDDEFMFHKGFRPMGPGPEFRGGGGGDFRAGSSNSPFARGRGEEMRAGKVMRVENGQVDKQKLKKAFLRFVRLINDSEGERLRYLENGKRNRQLQCLACHRSSKELSDMHALIMHTYYSDNAELIVDHLGLHKALCVLMGWNYSKPPDDSKAYQFLPADEAAANQDDLIIWPPVVLIHNTISGKREDGRLDGLKNKAMDSRIRELGIMGGKSNKLFNREGYTGMSIIRFLGDQAGLKEALKLADHFEKENCGRQAWARIQPVTLGKDDENNPNLVKTDRTGEKTRIWYGYLGTASDLHKIDYEARKKLDIESLQDRRASK